MPTITNKGQKDKLVADRIMRPGETKYVSLKQAQLYAGDPDLAIVYEMPQKAQPKTDSTPELFDETPIPIKLKQPRGKKKS